MTTTTAPLYAILANAAAAWRTCQQTGNTWGLRHANRIHYLVRNWLPTGSGFDAGTKFNLEASKSDRMVFDTSFHHMDEHGSYDGWTEHTVTVRPTFSGISITVSGRNKGDIKEYIASTFHEALTGHFDANYQLRAADAQLGL